EANAYRTAIWVAPLDGFSEPRQFTSGERNDGSPRWSPDGRWLAFVSNRDGEDEKKAKGQLYVLPADGGEPRRLTDGKESVEALYELDVDAEGAEPRRLTEPDESASNPSFSPDGSLIAYIRSVEDGTYPHHGQVAVMRADGSDRRVLTESLDRQCAPFPLAREPVWDGDRVAFGVEDGGNVHLYTVAADGSGEPELLVGGEQS